MTPQFFPNDIPAQSAPFIYQDGDGNYLVEEEWFLFLYGIWIQVRSVAGGVPLPPAVNIPMIDGDVYATDYLQDPRRINNVQALLPEAEVYPSIQDVRNALVLVQDALLPDTAGTGVAAVTGTAPVVITGTATAPNVTTPVFVASGTGHAGGSVPDPGATAGTTRFLREDATFAVPSGGSGGSVIAKAYLSATQSYSSGNVVVNLTAAYDPLGIIDTTNNWIKPPAGKYIVMAGIYGGGSSTTSSLRCYICKNGSASGNIERVGTAYGPEGNNLMISNAHVIEILNGTDYLQLVGVIFGSGTVSFTPGQALTFLEIYGGP